MDLLRNALDRWELRNVYYCLSLLHPNHRWRRRSGNPGKQLARNGYIPEEAIQDLGHRALSPSGKAAFSHIAQREGLPPLETGNSRGGSIRERYGPPRL